MAVKSRKSTDPLLARDDFREGVFKRDSNRCVVCAVPAVDAHHILERRLFEDGGYRLSNGCSLCAEHHILAEKTLITVEELRLKSGILAPALPEHFYPDETYDKWGNIVLPSGQRVKGELFYDGSVQKILGEAGILGYFTPWVKYPRTHHFEWSPGLTDDDRVHHSLAGFEGMEVVATEKLDGENTSCYRDYFHARSLDAASHPSQSWARAFHARIRHSIPEGWRICAENCYAKHSIAYNDLEHFIQVFSIWDEKNTCLSWDDTEEWCKLMDLTHVPILYRGLWDEQLLRGLHKPIRNNRSSEGYVVRVARSFQFSEFRKVVGKYVRAGHVQSSQNWRNQVIIPNSLKS